MTVKQFRVTDRSIYMVDTDSVWASKEKSFNIEEFGKTVFFKKEAAEKALAKMKGV